MASSTQKPIHILLINPNSSSSMTDGIMKALESLNLPLHITITPFTAPSPAPSSINNGDDISHSASVVLSHLTPAFFPSNSNSQSSDSNAYNAILIACFSIHPLVPSLSSSHPSIATTGIFEASILACLSLLSKDGKWGIVTTGPWWEDHLSAGVADFLGTTPNTNPASTATATSAPGKFAGVHTTGLNASDFHASTPSEVRRRLRKAAFSLLDSGPVECVVMGCAGMTGLEGLIREVAVEKYGEEEGRAVYIVDGVKAGIGVLVQMVENKRLFRL
ncbi:hydantoin racemase [Zalerion maritima]|uniref:Hydantoin racemase n=1 Tax=Zalerion maritima TaxID=339359 RepID=A0AAD5RNI9_9PEZI|nr:hydantoin racemase [Zalerion maritima]